MRRLGYAQLRDSPETRRESPRASPYPRYAREILSCTSLRLVEDGALLRKARGASLHVSAPHLHCLGQSTEPRLRREPVSWLGNGGVSLPNSWGYAPCSFLTNSTRRNKSLVASLLSSCYSLFRSLVRAWGVAPRPGKARLAY